MSDDAPTPEELAKADPTPETLAKSKDTGSEDSVARTLHGRHRSPALAFMAGIVLIGLIAGAAYLFWPESAQTPVVPTEVAITDEVPEDMPVPDGAVIRAQVDAALAQAPRDPSQRSEQAAAAAGAQTAPATAQTPAAPPAQPTP